MNESSITLRWEKNPDGCTDITVNGNINGHIHYREAFLSLETLPPIYDVSARETSSESAGKSATMALLTCLIENIRKSDKIMGAIISEQERNSKFPFTDLVAIRKFAEIAGIKFDERKFHNRMEFQRYFQNASERLY